MLSNRNIYPQVRLWQSIFSVTTSRCISVGRVHFCGGGEAAGRRGEVTQEPAGRRAEGHSYRPWWRIFHTALPRWQSRWVKRYILALNNTSKFITLQLKKMCIPFFLTAFKMHSVSLLLINFKIRLNVRERCIKVCHLFAGCNTN